jgi:hypothetical protein
MRVPILAWAMILAALPFSAIACGDDAVDQLPAGGGSGGGGGADPCLEPIVPSLWYFTNDITEDASFPFSVLPQSTFEGLLSAYGKVPEAGKGHILADARTCADEGARESPSADGVQFTLTGTGSEPLPANFYFDSAALPDPLATQTSLVPLGGFFNVAPAPWRIAVTPLDLGKQPSSEKNILVRPSYLTTLRMEPSVGLPTPTTSEELTSIPARWSCVGAVTSTPQTGRQSLKINVTVRDLASASQAVVPNIGFHVCAAADFACATDDVKPPDFVSDEAGQVSIDVPPGPDGSWRGYLVVKGQVRKSSAACAASK